MTTDLARAWEGDELVRVGARKLQAVTWKHFGYNHFFLYVCWYALGMSKDMISFKFSPLRVES